MSYKLEQALGSLGHSVEKLEQVYAERETRTQEITEKHSKPLPGQNDLFDAGSESGPEEGRVDSKAMAMVLDRTIQKMEKLVGERS